MIQTEYTSIIKKIAIENGKEIFFEPKKLKSFLLDHTKNEYKKENDFLLSVLDTGCVKYINEAEDLAGCKQFLLKRLNDEYNLSPSKSAEMLNILFLVLRGTRVQSLDEIRKSIARFQSCIAVGTTPLGNNESASHIIGLKADGTVVAVGYNDGNQCNTQHWRNIVAVSAGSNLSAGLQADGTVVLIKNRKYSEIKGDVTAISCGISHFVCLFTDGSVVAAGNNEEGQCNTDEWRNITAISARTLHTAGLKADSTVVAVGNNEYGQCNTQDWRDVVAVSTGIRHTIGLKADGTVVLVGDIHKGHYDILRWRDIIAISTFGAHTVGLKADGTVVVCGNNIFGECNVQGWRNYVAVCAGFLNTAGLKADGTVVVCGDNKFGQCNTQGWRNIGLVSDERFT